MKTKKLLSAALIACLLAAAFAAYCLPAFAEDAGSAEESAEYCTIDIAGAECFFVYYGKVDPVPSKIEKGARIDFNVMFKGGSSKPYVTLKANGETLELTEGKYYSYVVEKDTVFTVVSSDEPPAEGPGLGVILLIACGVSLVAVVAAIIILNKKEEKKAGKNGK